MNRRTLLKSVIGSATAILISDTRGLRAHAAGPGNSGRPRLSACIQAVFRDVNPFEARLDKVKEAGLSVFEFWSWRDKNLDALEARRKELGLECSIFSCDTGGDLVKPNSAEKFVLALRASIEAAKKLACKRLIATVGNELKDLSRDEQHRNIVEALKAGAPVLQGEGFVLCVEPLNVLVNHKGYYLATSAEAFQIMDEVGSPSVKVLFDIYHQQITEGNVINNITRNIGKIGHFHVADVPGRMEPGTGEINYLNVFRAIGKSGYDAFVGLEMWPKGDNVAAVKETKGIFDQAMSA
jgi:hydroxypyruvate isomerase